MSNAEPKEQEPLRPVEKNPTAENHPMERDTIDGRDEVPPAGENAEINDDRMEPETVNEAVKTIRERGSSGHP